MAANAFVRARIDEDLKNQAADVLAGMGLTISDLVRITLTKVAREKALPFDLREPNQLTIQSIKNSEAGVDVHKANKLKYLMTLLINNALPLPAVYKDHPLQGSWKGYRDAHVEPDWILIYKLTDKLLRFERTGTHAALFGLRKTLLVIM